MKKTRQFFTLLLAVLLMVSFFTINVSAYYGESAMVYMNGNRVSGIDAYLDTNGEVRVSSHTDLLKIFPKELESIIIVYNQDEGILVREYVDDFNYHCSQYGNVLSITTDPNNDYLPIFQPIVQQTAEVFVNGFHVITNHVYVSNGTAYISDYNDLITIFPKETATFPTYPTLNASSLESWAKIYEYSYKIHGSRVYLNNDGKSPVEIELNGKTVSFPDQQPIVVPPGRTMVPVYKIAELVNCTVKLDNNRVIIENNERALILWFGNTTYWLNGKYAQMDVCPQVINGRTMVPISFICDAFDIDIKIAPNSPVFTVQLSS